MRLGKICRNGLLTVLASSVIAGQAHANSWDFGAGTTAWEDALNWDNDALPVAGSPANSSGFSQAQSPVISASTPSVSVSELQVGVFNKTGFVTINGGTVGVTSQMYVGMFTNGIGTVNQSGGNVTTQDFVMGFDNNARGTYNMTGGNFTITANMAISGGNSGSVGAFNQSGGVFHGANSQIATSSSSRVGSMAISGSAQTTFTSTVEVGVGSSTGAAATLLINGPKTGAGSNFNADRVVVSSVGTLAFNIDAAAAQLDPLSLRSINTVTGQFDLGSTLDLGFTGAASSGTWTVWTSLAGISDSGLALAAGDAAAGWSYAIVGNNLQVSFAAVPEPSTYALMLGGLGVLALLRRRRSGSKA